jgi:hypothetical protein
MKNNYFIRKQRTKLPIKYARQSLQSVIRRQAKTTIQQMAEIDLAYQQYIETPTSD